MNIWKNNKLSAKEDFALCYCGYIAYNMYTSPVQWNPDEVSRDWTIYFVITGLRYNDYKYEFDYESTTFWYDKTHGRSPQNPCRFKTHG